MYLKWLEKKNKGEILENKFISMKPETDGWGNMQNDLKDSSPLWGRLDEAPT